MRFHGIMIAIVCVLGGCGSKDYQGEQCQFPISSRPVPGPIDPFVEWKPPPEVLGPLEKSDGKRRHGRWACQNCGCSMHGDQIHTTWLDEHQPLSFVCKDCWSTMSWALCQYRLKQFLTRHESRTGTCYPADQKNRIIQTVMGEYRTTHAKE